MITCPNCAHSNPVGAVNCESCFTPLPTVQHIQCPNCHSSVLSDAKFCGHCGFNLSEATIVNPSITPPIPSTNLAPSTEVLVPHPITSPMTNSFPDQSNSDDTSIPDFEENIVSEIPNIAVVATESPSPTEQASAPANAALKTQLQQFSASLLHVQTNLTLEIPPHLPVVHIGKPNAVIPPDIDVSGFPDSDIVSRIHADIRVEAGSFFFEDTGSSNGTYINNLPLPAGNRHKLRAGDRISLGKGDKVSFIFQFNP
ncbi:FHA domain-containing protein [Pseudanabaena mucicola]|uniref:FHA domain-containing protein n=1 Tax=Pseudanabaena mucicola FACHB-723 TaxID=2692860 RepID=A0ABR7ZTD7_9CYAN|nr:FHA domain-containing protein [Pseudanabaena mucicola]MBD2186725.1 FHA domain-containing protein [Pseudanabaena mucicola FACHB-723]